MPSPRIAPDAPDAPDAPAERAPAESASADEHEAVAVVPLAETGLTADASGTEGFDDGAAAEGDGDERSDGAEAEVPEKKREPTPEEIEKQRVRHEAAEKLRHENDPIHDGRRNSHAHDATGGFLGMIGDVNSKAAVVVGITHIDGELPDSKWMQLVAMPGVDEDGEKAESKGEEGEDGGGQKSARSDYSDEFASGSDDGDNSRGSPRENGATAGGDDSAASSRLPPPMLGAKKEEARKKTFVGRMIQTFTGDIKNPFVRQKAAKVMTIRMRGTAPTPIQLPHSRPLPPPPSPRHTSLSPSQNLMALDFVEEEKAKGAESSKRQKEEEQEENQLKRRGEGVGYPADTRTLDPNSPERGIWDGFIMLFLLYYSFVTPYEIAFLKTEPTDFLSILNYSIDFLFLVDLGLNFKTGYFDFSTGERQGGT